MIATEERPAAAADIAERPETRSWLAERISTDAAVLMAATWFVLFLIGEGVVPRTSEPTPAWSVALSVVFYGTLAVMAGGLIACRRWALVASLGGASLYTAFAVACPVSDHHPLAAWWFVQMACALGLVAASGYALTRARA